MFQFFRNFISGSWDRVQLTITDIIWTLVTIIILTLIGVFPSFCGTPIKHSFYLSFPIWIFSAYRLLSLWRYIHIMVGGEVIEASQAIGDKKNETIWDNPLAATYRKAAINIWLAQAIVFLAAPLYFNLTSGGRLWLPILIMVVFAIAMMSINFGLVIFRTGAVTTITILLLFAVYDMFPQVGMLPYVSEASAKIRAGKLSGENTRSLGDVMALREKQRQQKLAEVIAKAKKHQEANPGRDLPENLRKEIEAAKLGLTVSEYEEKLKTETEAKVRAKAEAKAEVEAETSKTPANISAASAVPIEIRKLCWQKPEGYDGVNRDLRSDCSEIISFKNEGDIVVFKIKNDGNGDTVYTGTKIGDLEFRGIWKQIPNGEEGEWEMKFSSPDLRSANNGWQTNRRYSQKVPSWIR